MSKEFDDFMKTVKGYPELEGTMNLCNDIIKKRTGKMTEKEWQAVERVQTSSQVSEQLKNKTIIKNKQKQTKTNK